MTKYLLRYGNHNKPTSLTVLNNRLITMELSNIYLLTNMAYNDEENRLP